MCVTKIDFLMWTLIIYKIVLYQAKLRSIPHV